jgi:hypothetical protein
MQDDRRGAWKPVRGTQSELPWKPVRSGNDAAGASRAGWSPERAAAPRDAAEPSRAAPSGGAATRERRGPPGEASSGVRAAVAGDGTFDGAFDGGLDGTSAGTHDGTDDQIAAGTGPRPTAGRPWRLALASAGLVGGLALLAGRDWHPSAPAWGAFEGLGLWLAKVAQHPVRTALAVLFLVLSTARESAAGAPTDPRGRSRAPPPARSGPVRSVAVRPGSANGAARFGPPRPGSRPSAARLEARTGPFRRRGPVARHPLVPPGAAPIDPSVMMVARGPWHVPCHLDRWLLRARPISWVGRPLCPHPPHVNVPRDPSRTSGGRGCDVDGAPQRPRAPTPGSRVGLETALLPSPVAVQTATSRPVPRARGVPACDGAVGVDGRTRRCCTPPGRRTRTRQ